MRSFLTLILMLGISGCGSGTPQPKTLTVNPDGSGSFKSIKEALETCNAGDTLKIKPGKFNEQLNISKNIEIVGDGLRDDIILTFKGDVISITAGTARVAGLTIVSTGNRKSGLNGVHVKSGAKAVIEDCEITPPKDGSAVCVREKADGIIKKCKLEGGAAGVYVVEGATSTVEDCNITKTTNSGIAVISDASIIASRNTIHHNFENGVRLLKNASGNFSENQFHNNGKYGFWVDTKSKATVSSNNFLRNIEGGICALVGAEITADGNSFSENRVGVWIEQGAKGSVLNNIVYGNTSSGIVCLLDATVQLEGNDVYENETGILIRASTITLKANKIHGNKRSGIAIEDTVNDLKCIDNEIFENVESGITAVNSAALTVSNNKIYQNGQSGILLQKKSAGELHKNTIYKNSFDGVAVTDESNALVTENTIYRNNGHVIYTSKSVVRASNNEHYDNGDVTSPVKERTPHSRMAYRITPAQKGWAMAACGVLMQRNGAFHELLGGWYPTTEEGLFKQRALVEWWDIKNRAELLQMLKSFEIRSHDHSFRTISVRIKTLPDPDFNLLLQESQHDPDLHNRLKVVRKYHAALKDKGLVGWEYSRYICLCRWGFVSGYISEEEAWNLIMPAARKLQSTFASWKELGENYIVGYQFWSVKQEREVGKANREAFDFMLNDPSSIWKKYAWDTDLTVRD